MVSAPVAYRSAAGSTHDVADWRRIDANVDTFVLLPRILERGGMATDETRACVISKEKKHEDFDGPDFT